MDLVSLLENLKLVKMGVIIWTHQDQNWRSQEMGNNPSWGVCKRDKQRKILEIFTSASNRCKDSYEILSENEYYFLQSALKSRNIPTPKLIIKDNKKPNENGDFPTRLIVSVNNFTSAFQHLGYLGIRKIFDSNKIEYETNTITQASDLKDELEKLEVKKMKSL